MDGEIQLISDGEGLAVIGEPGVVDRFLSSNGLESLKFDLGRLAPVARVSGVALRSGGQIAENAGHWVKLSDASASLMKTHNLMAGSSAGLSRAIVTSGGQTTHIVEFVKGSGAMLTNPAMLAGIGGIMAQYAMQQMMNEILDYLAVIDQKVDDILRAQEDSVLADMIGVDLVIDEAMTIREHVGSVSDVTWSKVQSTTLAIARTEAYSLRQLDAIAEKLERTSDVGDLSDATKAAAQKVPQWLAVLARCLQLQEAIGILELDRVFESSPDDLERHRIALSAAREKRFGLIATSTAQLLTRIDAASTHANAKVLVHPHQAHSVVEAGNHTALDVLEFRGRLGFEGDRDSLEARRWRDAAVEAKDKAIEQGGVGLDRAKDIASASLDKAKDLGGEGLDRAKDLGSTSLDHARSATSKMAERARQLRRGGSNGDADTDAE